MKTITVYRLYTEMKPSLPRLVKEFFTGATFFRGVGLWEDTIEKSCVIEIATDNELEVLLLAGKIKRVNSQQAVLVTKQAVEQQLI